MNAIPCYQALRRAILGAFAVCALVALPASARTVYDAGKALRQNFQNNATPANPYTDENGGIWKYSSAAGVAPFTSLGDFKASYAKIDNNQLHGWGGDSSPHLKVNITGHALTSSSFMTTTGGVLDGEPIEADEMMIHPGQTGNTYMVLRFIAPEDGWYSAFASFHDTAKEGTATASSGASVAITLGANDVLARGIVSLEGANNSTKRFDFQMPVRYMTAGAEIRFAIGNNAGSSGTVHASDATGVKVFVTKEDVGTFYDSGLAMAENLATRYENPFGDIANGTWYYLLASTANATTAPGNVSYAATSRIDTKATRSDAGNQRGFASNSTGSSPYVLLNETAVVSANVAPGELHVHPAAGDLKKWPAIRFRPPASGYYSGSVVARDLVKASSGNANGVDVYLYVSDTLVTNANVSLYTYQSTAHFTFDSIFMAAGEPVDILVSASGEVSSDGTGISAIFRRESRDVYDAGKSFYADRIGGSMTYTFADLLGGGAMWQLGAKTNAWSGAQFYDDLTAGQVAGGAKTQWWMQGRFTSYDQYPYFVMATNGTATIDSTFGFAADLLAAAPQEFVAVVNEPGYQSSSPTLKATVPSDGVYRARANARDLNNGGGDGVQVSVVADGHVAVTSPVKRDSGGTVYETALGADRLWLRGGDRIEYVVDPLASRNCDATGLSACYVLEESTPSTHVVNIDFGVPSSVEGRFSDHTGAGREGWSDWNRWNALRISNSSPSARVAVDNCREADGETKRNVTLTLARTSGNVTKGYTSGSMPTGSALHNNWAASTGPSDTYTFTLSKLKANEPYTLYLYSAKGGAAGNASFTVGGVTKTADEPWNLKDTKVVARFDVASDSNGEISGTFAAADANGGEFNGLTLVGEFPNYIPEAFVISLR